MLQRLHRHGKTTGIDGDDHLFQRQHRHPKGVVLTHANVLANVDSLDQIFPMEPGDCFIGVLPLFHSFGFTGTLWFPLLQGSSVVYHPNPMDAKTIGELAASIEPPC
jgi:acyl-CoA synthetase (AMP-forming)/AMP-acid ligase II